MHCALFQWEDSEHFGDDTSEARDEESGVISFRLRRHPVLQAKIPRHPEVHVVRNHHAGWREYLEDMRPTRHPHDVRECSPVQRDDGEQRRKQAHLRLQRQRRHSSFDQETCARLDVELGKARCQFFLNSVEVADPTRCIEMLVALDQ